LKLNIELTSSAPRLRTKASFFPEAVAQTVAPFALAIWMANMPTAELPPLMNTISPGPILLYSTTGMYALKEAIVMPEARIGLILDGRFATAMAGTRIYSASEPWRVLF